MGPMYRRVTSLLEVTAVLNTYHSDIKEKFTNVLDKPMLDGFSQVGDGVVLKTLRWTTTKHFVIMYTCFRKSLYF